MKKVAQLRVLVGMRSGELADKLGIKGYYYSRIETGVYKPKRIDEIETKCLQILLPLLRSKIQAYKSEIKRLEKFFE